MLQECDDTLKRDGEQRDSHQEQIAELEEKITAARGGLLTISNDLHAAQDALSTIQNRQSARAAERGRLEGEQEQADARLVQLDRLEDASREDIDAQEALALQGEKDMEAARADAEKAQQRADAADRELQEHKDAVLEAMERLSAVRSDQTRLHTMRGQMQERLASLETAARELREGETRLSGELDAAKDRLTREQEAERGCSDRVDAARTAQQEEETRQSAVRTRAEELSAQLQGTQARWKLLSDMSREMDGFNQTVRRAVQYAKDRRITGVRGVVAQLISVPEQYETAMDMVLGAAQQNIVTDTEETAKSIIDYLRQNKLGRATFLPQSSVRSNTLSAQERRVLSMPGCLGVASELVSFSEEHRGIV